ncbi:hypothetical protein SUGI_0937950 [Cryptomeria japonica]|nr:hypothetical protein SUGI_0937950 [Cryptomeria japonica]
MEEVEDITSYFHKVHSAVNEIKELGSTLTDENIIEKILMSLPESYTFKIRKFGKDKVKTESTFKAFEEDPKDESSNEMKENFVRRLKKGTGEYKERDVPKIDILKTVATVLHARRHINEWLIDSGCSNHMTGDKSKFVKLDKYDGGSVRFEDDQTTQIVGIGSISFDGKHNTNNVYYVKEGKRTGGNMYLLKGAMKDCLLSRINGNWLCH